MSKAVFDLDENPAQKAFITGTESFSAYIGGVGAGKTFGNIVRTLLMLTQDPIGEVHEKPRGLIGAESYPVLEDIIMPAWEKVQNIIRDRAPNGPFAEKQYIKSKRRVILNNGARIDFRSLDKPNSLRGRELTCFGIDEGRNVNRLSWDRLFDRLRQPGYRHAGYVTSTPAGHDWMYDLFHEDSPDRGFDPVTGQPFVWYNAPTYANERYLPQEYIARLKANLHGNMFEQEYMGRFIGTVEGSVYPEYDRDTMMVPLQYDPAIPFYSFWDFGIGDLGVVVFAQIVHQAIKQEDGDVLYIPHLHVLDAIGQKDLPAKDWAEIWYAWLGSNTNGRKPVASYGDPAGRQRNASGKSWMEDLAAEGVLVNPAPKKPQDFSIRILRNLMAGGRFKLNRDTCAKISAAIASHRWSLDATGNRVGNAPVHDWTSHYSDALRYGAASLLSFFPPRKGAPKEIPPPPGSIGDIVQRFTHQGNSGYLGPQTGLDKSWAPRPVGA